jgi:hypothetical protein
VDVPGTDEHLYRGRVASWTFRLRVPLLVLYTVVAGAAFFGGTTEDSDLAVLSVPGFAFACLVGYLSPAVGPLLALVAFAGGIVAGNTLDGGFENEASGINLIGGLLIAELCIFMGMWNRRRRRRAVEAWRVRNDA